MIIIPYDSSEEKEDVNQSVESTPQMTPIATNTTAPLQSPSSEQQPEIDEDGYCIQPKDPLWNTQWPKKGTFIIKFFYSDFFCKMPTHQSFSMFFLCP